MTFTDKWTEEDLKRSQALSDASDKIRGYLMRFTVGTEGEEARELIGRIDRLQETLVDLLYKFGEDLVEQP